MGYPATEGEEAVTAVLQALANGPTSPSSFSSTGTMENAVLALVLGLRTLLVAYGEDEGVAMFEVCGPCLSVY